MTLYRAFTGIIETVFFLVPQPGYYDPMIDPEFVWNGWEEPTQIVTEQRKLKRQRGLRKQRGSNMKVKRLFFAAAVFLALGVFHGKRPDMPMLTDR